MGHVYYIYRDMDWSTEYATKNDCTFEWLKCQVVELMSAYELWAYRNHMSIVDMDVCVCECDLNVTIWINQWK